MDVNSAGPLVSTVWLAERLADPRVRIVDATWFLPDDGRDGPALYERSHIPGAVFFDIDEVSDRASPLPHMLASPERFGEAVRELGIDQASTVVVYDAEDLFSAPRVWWNFRVMGHQETYVLDGGLRAWAAEGRPLESGWRTPPPGDFESRPDGSLVRDLDQVRAALDSGGAQVLDARSAERFGGRAPEPRAGVRAGHMPGARNVPYRSLTPQGRLAEEQALRGAFAAAGVDPARPIVTTCGSGVTAAVLALALARLGRGDVAVYDGSWAEWGSRADTPVAVGDGA